MKKMLKILISMFIISSVFVGICIAEDVNTVTIKGGITEVASNQTYIVIDGQKIMTTPEFFEEAMFEVGDKVEIIAKKTDKGLECTSYKYVYENEESQDDNNDQSDNEDTE